MRSCHQHAAQSYSDFQHFKNVECCYTRRSFLDKIVQLQNNYTYTEQQIVECNLCKIFSLLFTLTESNFIYYTLNNHNKKLFSRVYRNYKTCKKS